MDSGEKTAALKKLQFGKKINKLEARFRDLLPEKVEYVGDHAFWVCLKGGQPKNPDFVVRPFSKTKKVIEVFGSYWHPPEDEKSLIKAYQEAGVDCLVVWDHEINGDCLSLVNRIQSWLPGKGNRARTPRSRRLF